MTDETCPSDAERIRSPICTTLGHVDHGKSSILDTIRGSAIVAGEAGKITQSIGASIVPLEVIRKRCGSLLDALNMNFTIPGLLFIDTPGHAAFTSLRKRGGSLADIAILVVDLNEGFKPQTLEALEILKQSKTPFVVAANKLDLVGGFQHKEGCLLEQVKNQSENTRHKIDMQLYELVGKLSEYGFDSERFDRVEDFTKKIAIIPTSAKEGTGIPELMTVIAGLAQRFLEANLHFCGESPGRANILEVKEEKGLGKTIDVILHDGTIRVNDTIIIGTLDEPIVTKVKALLEPIPLAEIRDKKVKYKHVPSVTAAVGVKIAANELDGVVAGMPLRVAHDDIDEAADEIRDEVDEVLVQTDAEGIVIKADSIGSLEALSLILKEKEIPVKRASIGNITKKDIIEASANLDQEPLYSVILGFNVKSLVDGTDDVMILTDDVIYTLVERFEGWMEKKKGEQDTAELDKLVRPSKVRIMPGYVFRQSNPAVVGVEIMQGTLRSNTPVMNLEGKAVSRIKGIQLEQGNIEEAEEGKQVAIALPDVTVGRQIKEGDILYANVPEDDFKALKEFKKHLSDTEKDILKEIAKIKRASNPVWGI